MLLQLTAARAAAAAAVVRPAAIAGLSTLARVGRHSVEASFGPCSAATYTFQMQDTSQTRTGKFCVLQCVSITADKIRWKSSTASLADVPVEPVPQTLEDTPVPPKHPGSPSAWKEADGSDYMLMVSGDPHVFRSSKLRLHFALTGVLAEFEGSAQAKAWRAGSVLCAWLPAPFARLFFQSWQARRAALLGRVFRAPLVKSLQTNSLRPVVAAQHPVYDKDYLESIVPKHKKPDKVRCALLSTPLGSASAWRCSSPPCPH